jgi:phage terminase small subunit
MGLPKRLTEMQMRFAELLVFGDEHGPLTQTEAAVKAGYSPKRARQEDRKIIKTGKLEDMSEQELEAKMKQILNDYGKLIDVTPSTTSESSSPTDEESSSDPQK